MRRISKRNTFDKMNREIIIVSLIFMMFVAIGAYLNKLYPAAQQSILQNISSTIEYYNSDIDIKSNLISNIKADTLFLGGIALSTGTVVLLPIAGLIFIVKGLSVGYTINSLVLGLKIKSTKIILITLIKCIIVLPGALILVIVSAKYITEIIKEIKKNNKDKIIFLVKRYFLNSVIIVLITVVTQLIINAISIATLQIFF